MGIGGGGILAARCARSGVYPGRIDDGIPSGAVGCRVCPLGGHGMRVLGWGAFHGGSGTMQGNDKS